jgi:hypothetical protein
MKALARTIVFMLVAWNSGIAMGYGDPHRSVEVGRLPDVIFPPGRAGCAVIIPAFIKFKQINVLVANQGTAGVFPRVRNGFPHVGVAANRRLPCIAANYLQYAFEISSAGSGVLEQTAYTLDGIGIFSDGTPGNGTIEFVAAADDTDSHLPGGLNYVIGTLNYFVPSSSQTSASDTAFTQTVSSANVGHLGTSTVLDFPLANGQPSVKLHLQAAWGYGAATSGVYNNHPIAAVYGYDVAGRWSIVNKDGGAMPTGAQFNVEVASATDDGAFTAPQAMGYQNAFLTPTAMDHDPQALMFASASSLGNPNAIGVYYNTGLTAWEIFGEGGANLGGGPTYVTRGVGASDIGSYIYNQQGGTISGNQLPLSYDHNVTAFSRIFLSNTSVGPVPSEIGVQWSSPTWVAYRQDQATMPSNASINVYLHKPAIIAAPTPGDSTGDRLGDISMVGVNSMPIAYSLGAGTFGGVNVQQNLSFLTYAGNSGAKAVAGDFDADGRIDVALTGPTGWTTIPAAFSNGDGTFRETNGGVEVNDQLLTLHPSVSGLPATGDAGFTGYASAPGAIPVSGDFNNDGMSDIALTGVSGWSTIPIAFSRGNGTFVGTNRGITQGDSNFPGWAAAPGVKVVGGDFNGDGTSDIALTGGAGWTTLPIAFSYNNIGFGSFRVENRSLATVPARAAETEAKVLAGDFDGDGKTDIAVVGDSSCEITIAFSNGDGTFHVGSSGYSLQVCMYGYQPSVRSFAGDFNGDGKADIGLVTTFYNLDGSQYRQSLIAFSNGDGTFTFSTHVVDVQQTADPISMVATNSGAVLSASQGSPALRDLARGRPTTESQPTLDGNQPFRAGDGNPDGTWDHQSVTHTDYMYQPYWQVDLGADRYVKYVDVFNRTDCCADRLSNYKIVTSLSDGTITTITVPSGTAGVPSSFMINAQARYVKIQLMGTNYLSLAEVYVWGQ